ncbi:RtcB family protein [Candidatus Pacearchaeota archaeon]|nr:RtcB family protein [Candidatus Pacearchaeota archaeon]
MAIELKKISENELEIPEQGKMNVPGRIFASPKLIDDIKKDKAIEQVKNVACLPGIIGASLAMPDCHQGYGFPIGGVAAFDMDKGIISPGGVGYDINCGVRLLATNISIKDFMKKRKEILHAIFRTIPSGVGVGGKRYTKPELLEVLEKGAEWAVEKGMGVKEDLEHCEENGKISPAKPSDVSQRAIARGLPQLGTLGAGNHFLEFQKVEEIFDEKIAKAFGIDKDSIMIMVHCGSRGLGHQVASDYIKLMEQEYGFDKLEDRELVNAPINSLLGKKYLSAMNCAVNFALCNRQMIMHYIREQLKYYFPNSKIKLVYDVCHNIAKIEEHVVKGKKQKLCVHRKGATRAFGEGHKDIPEDYRKFGQPVLIPGSMGTSSYVLVGTKKAEEISFASAAHGAGRIESRTQARHDINAESVKKQLKDKDIILEAGSSKGIVEEAPEVYKNIDEVVQVTHKLGIAKLVAKLKPLAVMKG